MKLSKVNKITKSIEKTYDITVRNNHNFFCNGYLIHNCDYRGEVGIIVDNIGVNTETINHGDRIAQIVFCPIVQAILTDKETLDETKRGEGGMGSTGMR